MPTEAEFRLMSDRVTRTETLVGELHTRLLGNGQPGVIKELQDDVDVLKARQNYLAGISASVGTLIGATIPFGLKWLLSKAGIHLS